MTGEGKGVTLPTLDIDDFMGKSFTTGPGRASSTSCPTSSSPTFTGSATTGSPTRRSRRSSRRPRATTSACRSTGRPTRTSPTSSPITVKEINGVRVYGHMDYGKKDPSLGWRFTDAWLSMAGSGDKGIPERPAGRRVGHPHGGLPAGRLERHPRRRHQRPGGGVRACRSTSTGSRPTRRPRRRHDLLRGRPGPGPGRHRPADLLVHGVHRRVDQGRACR